MKWLLLSILLSFSVSSKDAVKVINTFQDFENQYLTNKNDDTTYVINFWATWCKPCVQELPYFEQFNEKHKAEPYKVLLVSLDFAENVESKVKPLVAKKNLKSEVVVLADDNASEWIDKVDTTWSGAIPATLIIKNGQRRFYEKSYESYDELNSEIIK